MSFKKTLWVRDLVHGVTNARDISVYHESPNKECRLACGGYVFAGPDDKLEMVTCVRCIVAEQRWVSLA